MFHILCYGTRGELEFMQRHESITVSISDLIEL